MGYGNCLITYLADEYMGIISFFRVLVTYL